MPLHDITGFYYGTRCRLCATPTSEPLSRRPPCACGSRCWITGPGMDWPPAELRGDPVPAFLLGEFPRADVRAALPAGRGGRYILDENHVAVPCPDLMTWARWIEGSPDPRRVGLDQLDGCEVSTVFLGLDHSWGQGPPILFETLVFGGVYDQEMERYSTWDEAVAGHARMVEKCRNPGEASPPEGRQ